MNLLAKRFSERLAVLAVALIFFSCENDASLLGFKNPNKKFNVAYVELPIESSVLSIDSVVTDNKGSITTATSTVLIGTYTDNYFGKVKSQAFLQLGPLFSTRLEANAIYDSVKIQVRSNFYSYGLTGKRIEKFTIHEITSDTLSRLSSDRYTYNKTFDYNPSPLGEAAVTVNYDSLVKQRALAANLQDTLVAVAKLNDDFGQRLFNIAANTDFKTNADVIQLITQIKGLVLVPSQSEAIIGFNVLASNLSHVTLFYHTSDNGVNTPLIRHFVFNVPSFSNITTDRSATELATLFQPYKSIQPVSGLRYIQSGSPVITKLDLKKFYEFADADSNQNILINSAELVIENVESPVATPAHNAFSLILMNSNDLFANARVTADYNAFKSYYAGSSTIDPHFYVISDYSGTPVSISYQSSSKDYSGFTTLFAQSLLKHKNIGDAINPDRLMYIGIVPGNPSIGISVNRTVFSASDIKLRINFTRPLSLNSN